MNPRNASTLSEGAKKGKPWRSTAPHATPTSTGPQGGSAATTDAGPKPRPQGPKAAYGFGSKPKGAGAKPPPHARGPPRGPKAAGNSRGPPPPRTKFNMVPNAELLRLLKIEQMYPCLAASSLKRFSPSPAHASKVQEYLSHLKSQGKRSSVYLTNPSSYQRIETCVKTIADRNTVLFSIDVEAYERFNDQLLEIGISVYDPRLQENAMFPVINQFHIVFEETLHLRNGLFVPDNRAHFLGGDTLVLSRENAATLVQLLINHYFVDLPQSSPGYNTALVGHAVGGDVSWFKSVGITFPPNPLVLDSKDIWAASQGENGSSLGKVLQKLRVNHSHLHNAGNDAYFTLLLVMMLGDPYTRLHYRVDHHTVPVEGVVVPPPARVVLNGASRKPRPVTSFGQFKAISHPKEAIETVLIPKNP